MCSAIRTGKRGEFFLLFCIFLFFSNRIHCNKRPSDLAIFFQAEPFRNAEPPLRHTQGSLFRCKWTIVVVSTYPEEPRAKELFSFLGGWAEKFSTLSSFLKGSAFRWGGAHRSWKVGRGGLKAKGRTGWIQSFLTAATATRHTNTHAACARMTQCVFRAARASQKKINKWLIQPTNSLHDTLFSRGLREHPRCN